MRVTARRGYATGAALDLAGHSHLRRPRRSVAGDAARLARQNGVALGNSSSVSSAPSRAPTARTASKAITANPILRWTSTSASCSRATSKRLTVRSRQGPRAAGRELAETAAGKGLSQLCDGICPHRRPRDGAGVRAGGCRLSAPPHRQADRDAVFPPDREKFCDGAGACSGIGEGFRLVPARAVGT